MARLPGRTIALTPAALVIAAVFSWTRRLDDEAERLPALQHPGTPDFPREPLVILSLQDSWIELRLRYLVDTHRRSMIRTQLAEAWQEAAEPHADWLPNVYPRSQPMPLAGDGVAGAVSAQCGSAWRGGLNLMLDVAREHAPARPR